MKSTHPSTLPEFVPACTVQEVRDNTHTEADRHISLDLGCMSLDCGRTFQLVILRKAQVLLITLNHYIQVAQ